MQSTDSSHADERFQLKHCDRQLQSFLLLKDNTLKGWEVQFHLQAVQGKRQAGYTHPVPANVRKDLENYRSIVKLIVLRCQLQQKAK